MTIEHVPDKGSQRQVERMGGLGLPHEQIAAVIGIDAKTLRKHYRPELDQGKAKANVTVAETLFIKATKGMDTTALIWWTKSQMGWSSEGPVDNKEQAVERVSGVEVLANLLKEHDIKREREGAY